MAKKNSSKVRGSIAAQLAAVIDQGSVEVSEQVVVETPVFSSEAQDTLDAIDEARESVGNVKPEVKADKKAFVNYHNWPESEQLDRKTRKIGSDDLRTAADACKYGREAGLTDDSVEIAYNLSVALAQCVELALEGKHEEAGKNAASCLHILRDARDIGDIEVQCRDGETRCVGYITKWYANVHTRIAEEVAELRVQEAAEAEVKALKNAEIQAKTAEIMAKAEADHKAKLVEEARKLAGKTAKAA
jgi:hypothetical protein